MADMIEVDKVGTATLEIMQIVCDEICKYVGHLNQEDLEEQCENCPLVKKLNSEQN